MKYYFINKYYIECLKQYNTNNNRGKRKYHEIFQKKCKQHKRNQGTKKTAILGTAHVLRTGPMFRYFISNMGNNITCGTDRKYRAAPTLYALETRISSGIQL